MHELLLCGQIPAARHSQLLHILAGLTAMQPHRIVERHAVYKPTRPRIQFAAQVGGSQALQSTQKQALQKQLSKDMFFVTLVQKIEDVDNLANGDVKEKGIIRNEGEGSEEQRDASHRTWSIRLTDVPEPAKRPVTMRFESVTDVLEGDVHTHMLALGYSFVDEYILDGHRLIHNNVVLLLHRLLKLPAPDPADLSDQMSTSDGDTKTPVKVSAPRPTIPPLNSMQPVDSSGSYVLQASVRVMDGTKPELVTSATKELLAVQAELKGVVGLRVVDRLALDTRVK